MEQIRIKKHYKAQSFSMFDYLLMGLTLQFSYVPFWTTNRIDDLVLLSGAFYAFIRYCGINRFNPKMIILFVVYTFLALLQGVMWEFSLISWLSSFTFIFITAYFLFESYGLKIFILFERVFRCFTMLSFVIWIIQQTIPTAENIIDNIIIYMDQYSTDAWPRSMLIYTHWNGLNNFVGGLSRNAGFLHEPGGFAVLLILALSINYLVNKKFFYGWNWLYIISLITTFSTAGYLSLLVLLCLSFINSRYSGVRILLFPIFIVFSIFLYMQTSFLGAKIESQVKEQIDMPLNNTTSGRFFALRKSLYVALKYPLYGRGLNSITKPKDVTDPEYAGYGWGEILAKYGMLWGTIFMVTFFCGFLKIRNFIYGVGYVDVGLIFIANIINLSSQVFITTPLFLIFFFLGLGMLSPRKQTNRYLQYLCNQNEKSNSNNKLFF